MNKESIEIRLFDLLESYTFEALQEDDKLFVLSHMTEQEYINQQNVIASTDQIQYPKVVPLPLAAPQKKAGFWMSPIPIYQILVGAAAAVIAVILLWPREQNETQNQFVNTEKIVDTVYHAKVVYDTVYKTEIERIYIERSAEPKTEYVNNCDESTPKRMLEVNASQSSAPINPDVLTSKTQSLKSDKTATLLPEVREFGL